MEINDKIRISFLCARNDEWFKYEFFLSMMYNDCDSCKEGCEWFDSL